MENETDKRYKVFSRSLKKWAIALLFVLVFFSIILFSLIGIFKNFYKMNTVLDNNTDLTGWSESVAGLLHLNEIKEHSAEKLIESVLVKFENQKDEYVEKDYLIDLAEYTEIRFYVQSVKKDKRLYLEVEDFSYRVDFGFGNYYLPVTNQVSAHRFQLPASSTLSTVKITCLHDDLDYLYVSKIAAVNEDMPYDIALQIAEDLQPRLPPMHVGKVSGDIATLELTAPAIDYIDRSSKIKVKNDTYQVKDFFGDKMSLTPNKALTETYANEDCFLLTPVEIETQSDPIAFPKVTIWHKPTESAAINSRHDFAIDTYNIDTGKCYYRELGADKSIAIQIDAESRHKGLLETMADTVFHYIEEQKLYVNCRSLNIKLVDTMQLNIPQIEAIPKTSHTVAVIFQGDKQWALTQINFPTEIEIHLTVEPMST